MTNERLGDLIRKAWQALLPAGLLTFGVIAWEHLVHAGVLHAHQEDSASAGLIHYFRDSALAFPMAVIAVVVGLRLCRRLGLRAPADLAARAAVVSVLFTVFIAPSVGVHGLIDRFLDPAVQATTGAVFVFELSTQPAALAAHGIRDAAIGQAAALPLALLGLWLSQLTLRPVRSVRPPRAGVTQVLRSRPARLLPIAAAAVMTLGLTPGAGNAALIGTAALSPDPHCGLGSTAPQRTYKVDAINLPIVLNRFGVRDPFGFMYVLDQNETSTIAWDQRALKDPTILSNGLQDDPVQPLVIRANLGDCLTITLRNDLTHGYDVNAQTYNDTPPDVSIHIHGVAETVLNAGSQVGDNPGTFASADPTAPNHSVTYSVFVDPTLGEGAHQFHSHGDSRQMQVHGLFGSLVAEPKGSAWLDPFTAVDESNTAAMPLGGSGSQRMIVPPSGPAFREFVPIYHEVGDQLAFNPSNPHCPEATGLKSHFPVDINGNPLATVCDNDPFTDAYAPCTKAISYRSECFFERLSAVQAIGLPVDESQGYGSYTHGDVSTPIFMAYLGDPEKTRLINGGSEMGHVHHMHGGAVRWRRNPGSDPGNDISGGLEKVPDQNAQSIRLDSQTIQPGESYNLEHECGAGGCQQTTGDFLYHCHIAHHYVAGMFGFYRVFDTLQAGGNATVNGGRSSLTLQTLPHRAAPPRGVTSTGLLGRTVPTPAGNRVVVETVTSPSTQIALAALVEPQLPPRGVTVDSQDAAVWNWALTNDSSGKPTLYQQEPATTTCWANYCDPADAGKRLPILFDPNNGRYAYPLLRPHLGHRPPFSPNFHTGAPWLGEDGAGTVKDGLCPSGAPKRTYNVTAVTHAFQETSTANGGDVDPNGQIFMLAKDIPSLTSTNFTPLAIRANVGDCVDVSLTSELNPKTETGVDSKVNMHIHFVQFDPQGSDGVITGLNFEQSVKPFSTESRTLTASASEGSTVIKVSNLSRLQVGEFIAIGQGLESIEYNRIVSINSATKTLTLLNPIDDLHNSGEAVGVEFVRYRWYADVDSGTVFWHDHVDGLHSWGHGLFGALIIEPAGCSWLDPTTGLPVRSGAMVDISCPPTATVGFGQSGSFREFMIWLHNDLRSNINTQNNPTTGGPPPAPTPEGCNFGSFNLRAEPFKERINPGPTVDFQEGNSVTMNGPASPNNINQCPLYGHTLDPYTFSSVTYGDPYTPMLRAYPGDPVVIRTIGLVERIGALRITGHRFRIERFNAKAHLEDTGTTGISERFDYVLDGGAGGPLHLPGDYLYYSTLEKELGSGAWGIFRVYGSKQSSLETLPGTTGPPTGPGFPFLTPFHRTAPGQAGPVPPLASNPGNPCPAGVRTLQYSVVAFGATLPLRDPTPPATFGGPPGPAQADANGMIYALAADEPGIKAGTEPVVPLVLRANQGDCISISLKNDNPPASPPIQFNWGAGNTRVGMTPALVLFDPQGSYGAAIGLNPDSSAGPGQTVTYKLYADQEVGTTLWLNFANQDTQFHGAYGALVIEPDDSYYTKPDGSVSSGAGLAADIHSKVGKPTFREMVVLEQSLEPETGRSIMDYYNIVHQGNIAFNYTDNPLVIPTESSIQSLLRPGKDLSKAFATDSLQGACTPSATTCTPTVQTVPAATHFFANAGDPVRVRFADAVGQFPTAFSFDGHCWPWEPLMTNSDVLCARTSLPSETIDAQIIGGAGGPDHSVGDWLFSDHRQVTTESGGWGILTVCNRGSSACKLEILQ